MTSKQEFEKRKYAPHDQGHGGNNNDWAEHLKEKAKHAVESASSNETVQKLTDWAMNDKLAAFLSVMVLVGLVLFPFYGALSGIFLGVALGMAFVDEITGVTRQFGRYYEKTPFIKVATLGVAALFVLVELPTLVITTIVVALALNLIRGRGM